MYELILFLLSMIFLGWIIGDLFYCLVKKIWR